HGFDNQRVPFPVTDRISQITRRESLPMGAAVGWDDAKEAPVHIIVQKRHLAGVLEDLLGRSNAWHARRLALQHCVGLDLAVAQIFDFGQELRFVRRKIGGCGRGGCRSSTTAALSTSGRWFVPTWFRG